MVGGWGFQACADWLCIGENLPCFIPGGRIEPNKKYGGAVYAWAGKGKQP